MHAPPGVRRGSSGASNDPPSQCERRRPCAPGYAVISWGNTDLHCTLPQVNILYWTQNVETGDLLPVFVPVPVGSILPMKSRGKMPPNGCVPNGYKIASEYEPEIHVQPQNEDPQFPPSTAGNGVLQPFIAPADMQSLMAQVPRNATRCPILSHASSPTRPPYARTHLQSVS